MNNFWGRILLAVTLSTAMCAGEVATPANEDVPRLLRQVLGDDKKVHQAAFAELAKLPGNTLAQVVAEIGKLQPTAEQKIRLHKAHDLVRRIQFREQNAAKLAEHVEWNYQTTGGAYLKVGRRNQKWDARVDEMFRGLAKMWGGDPAGKAEFKKTFETSTALLNLGCDDIMVKYANIRMNNGKTKQQIFDDHVAIADELAATDYPAVRKGHAFINIISMLPKEEGKLSPENLRRAEAILDKALGYYGVAAMDKTIPRLALLRVMEFTQAACKHMGYSEFKTYERMFPIFDQGVDRAPILVQKGLAYIHSAWEARGNGFANTVTEEGWKLFAERIKVARAALEEAYKLDPADPQPPLQMLTVELAQGNGRDEMELWYGRAMHNDPDSFHAPSSKMYYLEPKWHGSFEEMILFGKELLYLDNWTNSAPYVYWTAMRTICKKLPLETQSQFLANPLVWNDIEALYAGMVKKDIAGNQVKGPYLLMACRAEKWEIALGLFNELGDKAFPTDDPEVTREMKAARIKAADYMANKKKE